MRSTGVSSIAVKPSVKNNKVSKNNTENDSGSSPEPSPNTLSKKNNTPPNMTIWMWCIITILTVAFVSALTVWALTAIRNERLLHDAQLGYDSSLNDVKKDIVTWKQVAKEAQSLLANTKGRLTDVAAWNRLSQEAAWKPTIPPIDSHSVKSLTRGMFNNKKLQVEIDLHRDTLRNEMMKVNESALQWSRTHVLVPSSPAMPLGNLPSKSGNKSSSHSHNSNSSSHAAMQQNTSSPANDSASQQAENQQAAAQSNTSESAQQTASTPSSVTTSSSTPAYQPSQQLLPQNTAPNTQFTCPAGDILQGTICYKAFPSNNNAPVPIKQP